MPYTIEEHKHRFSAWAAGRAVSVNGCRFSVKQAKEIFVEPGLKRLLANPNNLPLPHDTDARHREWRDSVIKEAANLGLTFTHGVAEKLITSVLLDVLSRQNIGGYRSEWEEAKKNPRVKS
jgi:hypothetical protein